MTEKINPADAIRLLEAREAVAELVRQSGAEIVGLCEMGGEAAVRDLQMRLKRKGVHLPYKVLVMRDGEDRGLALLSKYCIADNRSVADMPVSGEAKRKKTMLRGILDATVSMPDGRLFRLVGIHLKSRLSRDGSAEDTRRREAYALRDYLNEALASQDGMPLLLYGDFNDGPSDSAVQVIQGPAKTEYRLNRLKPRDSRGETWTIYYEDGDTYHSFDHLFLINTQDIRLCRRTLRDAATRGRSPEKTLAMWERVLDGETRYIKGFKTTADFLLDTSFTYELGLIAKLLGQVRQQFTLEGHNAELWDETARRFEHVMPLELALLPEDSMLREFYGGAVK